MAGDDLAARRVRHVARFERLLAALRSRIEWSADRLAGERERALRALVAIALTRSGWHRERLAGVDVERLGEADLAGLPVMSKTELIEHFDEVVTDRRLSRLRCDAHLTERGDDPYLLGEYQVVASGGSSGQPGVFVYGWDAWATCYASIVRFQQRDWENDPSLAGVERSTAVVAAATRTHISAALSQTFSTPHEPRSLFPVTWPIEDIVDALNHAAPTVLMAYSSFLPRLADEARRGHLHIGPRRVIAISEPLLAETRALVEQTWRAPVASGYGMSEGAFTGACGHGMHLPDDLCVIEPVDTAGRPVKDGRAASRIYLTNLYNTTLPLIRYEVTDELSVLPEACPCGSAMRRIHDPQGRSDELFHYADITVHPHVFRSILAEYPQILEYQIRQTPQGAAVTIVTHADVDMRQLQHQLAVALTTTGVRDPHITTTTTTSIPRPSSGKLTRFIAHPSSTHTSPLAH